MNRTRVLVEHGYAHVPWNDSEIGSAPVKAIDLSAGFLARFFIAPYKMNLHSAHHRVPSIPFYRSVDLLLLLEQHGHVERSTDNPSYFQALRHVLWN
jgi:fatty acid desaturase